MVDPNSPLGATFRPGSYGNLAAGPRVRLAETTPRSILEAAAWPGRKDELAEAIAAITGLSLTAAPNTGAVSADATAFSIGPDRFLIAGSEMLAALLAAAVPLETGTVTDLSHGRTAIRAAGARAEWVLSKLFAIDFSSAAFPIAEGRATAHHDIAAQIQRTDADQFDIFVFRSFARSFWIMLCDAAEEVGYEVMTLERP